MDCGRRFFGLPGIEIVGNLLLDIFGLPGCHIYMKDVASLLPVEGGIKAAREVFFRAW